jgi:DtxR family Mn-dependent transcriptional regulator
MSAIELSESAEEILSGLWATREEQAESAVPVSDLDVEDRDAAMRELLEAGLAEQHAGLASLTDSGEQEAAAIVRRERLAERLLSDVLSVGEDVATEAACKFEHLLRKGIDDEICTLLGHPRVCPHGSPIPRGECCRAGAKAPGKVVSALADLAPGQGGSVAYIHARRPEMMRRLLDMGAVPGAEIALVQSFPSYVFRIGESQVAVDRETAQDVYVRIAGGKEAAPSPSSWLLRPLRGLRRRRGRHAQ